MKISQLFHGIPAQIPYSLKDLEIKGLKVNSKDVRPGDLFVAIKGNKTDGHLFVIEALSKGALAAVCNNDYDCSNDHIIKVQDTAKALPLLASNFHNNPAKDMVLIGITGTNGKTTTSYIIESILTSEGIKAGVIGTLGYKIGQSRNTLDLTTPDPLLLMSILAEMKTAGVRYVIMEVSSHSLAQHRVDCCHFNVAIFTNLSRDHLDYHKDMEDYFNQKKRLFEELIYTNGHTSGISVINFDNQYGVRLTKAISNFITFGLSEVCNIHPLHYELTSEGISSAIETGKFVLDIKSKLLGMHNLYNIMAGIGAAVYLDAGKIAIENGIYKLSCVPGRLEPVNNNLGIKIFIDYAHTPDALQNVLNNLRPFTKGRLILVFGCGGDRDRGKRPLMGQVGVSLADRVFLTSDNPRSEDPLAIIKEIEAGIRQYPSKNPYHIEPDRKKAIELAIIEAKEGDTVLIAGKGHEDYQIIGNEKIYFSDKEVAEEIVRRLKEGN